MHIKLKTTLCAAALLALASPAFAALTYSYSVAPGFSGGSGLYLDHLAGTARGQANTPFASGDLADGVIAHDNWEPLADFWPDLVAWDPLPLAATITIDLGAVSDVSAIDITTFAWSAFDLGAPTGVTIDYSTTTTFAGPGTYHAFTDGGDNAVSHAGEVTTSASGVQFIQLSFDGTSTKSKWALTEIGVSFAGDPFEIISVVRNSDTEVEITWNSKPGITYAINRSTEQGTINWGEVDDGTIGTGETASYTDSNIPAGSKDVFYRVRVVE